MKRIMLACSAGMSTSLLVTKMEKAAQAMGYDADIFAVSVSEADTYLGDSEKPIDVLLLGPQVKYMEAQFKEKWAEKLPVEVIDMRDYGMMDGEAVLKRAIELIG
ncbi:PTS sugar transporter subunit IIB [Vagococcus sp.]|uniref:PTS sugar transporter subunit IIB n=1 Tax=Vagococcus sp. TaxID=1933889 RepID=UPI003F9E8927